ncbi:unnamed protein product [Polarella glacialis]|uniref:Uncharacterized protein n=1 Tax=Polarella glacialis TaxID=89957 RepID=A0A813HL90_POLGL|nr:unnamed protein product [Polarella glacialis]
MGETTERSSCSLPSLKVPSGVDHSDKPYVPYKSSLDSRANEICGSGPGIFLGPPGVLTAAMRWVPLQPGSSSASAGTALALASANFKSFAFTRAVVQGPLRRNWEAESDQACSEDSSGTAGDDEAPAINESGASSASMSSGDMASATPTLSGSLSDACGEGDRCETCSSQSSMSDMTFSPPCSEPPSPGRQVCTLDSEFAGWTLLQTDISTYGSSMPDSPSLKTWGSISDGVCAHLQC